MVWLKLNSKLYHGGHFCNFYKLTRGSQKYTYIPTLGLHYTFVSLIVWSYTHTLISVKLLIINNQNQQKQKTPIQHGASCLMVFRLLLQWDGRGSPAYPPSVYRRQWCLHLCGYKCSRFCHLLRQPQSLRWESCQDKNQTPPVPGISQLYWVYLNKRIVVLTPHWVCLSHLCIKITQESRKKLNQ